MSGKIKGKQLRDLTIEGLQIANDTIDADKIVETGTLSTINAGDAAVDGVAAGIARKDHQHAVATAAAPCENTNALCMDTRTRPAIARLD